MLSLCYKEWVITLSLMGMQTIFIVRVEYLATADQPDITLAIVAKSVEEAMNKARKHITGKATQIWSTEILAKHRIDSIITA